MTGLRKSVVAATAMAAIFCVSGTASATAQFKSLTSSVGSTGALNVSFNVSGLGNVGTSQQIVLGANVTATWGCVNRSLKVPRAENKISVGSPVSSVGYFTIPRNGTVQGTVSTSAPTQPAGWSCTGSQTPTLLSVSYTDVVLVVGGTTQPAPSVSRTFLA